MLHHVLAYLLCNTFAFYLRVRRALLGTNLRVFAMNHQSEDIRLLRQEFEQGLENIERIAQLRDECAALAWRSDDVQQRCSR